MPLNKLQFNPGINKEITKYSNEQGWNDCDKVRFRQGYPEKIGGWRRYGVNTFLGVCRSLHQWVSNSFVKYIGLGTHVKFYIEEGFVYNDITPIRLTTTIASAFTTNTTAGTEKQVRVNHASHGATLGSYVTMTNNTSAVGGIPADDFNKEHRIIAVASDGNSYTIEVATSATSVATGGGVTAIYQINAGPDSQTPTRGWQSNSFDEGTWNGNANSTEDLRVWNQANYGEDLIIGARGGKLFYWDTSAGTGTRAVEVAGVNNGTPVELSVTTTGTWNTAVAGISSLDAAETAKLYVGQTISGTDIPGGTTITSIGGNGQTLFMSASPTGNHVDGTLIFGNDPISTIGNTTKLTVYDPTLTRTYEVGQFVTIAGCSGAIAGIAAEKINARHKIESVDSAANTFTTEPISGIDAATSSASGGGGAVTAQYELSAEVPVVQNHLLVSDVSRFVFCFGTNAFGDTTETLNPMLIRWSDQEDMFDWRPRSTNQAGDFELSQGTEIVAAIQSRQEILVFTDAAVYSLQYVGAPVVWSSQLVGSNTSIASSKAVAYANGIAYWMGVGKFYKYDGTTQPLRCDVRKHVFDDLDVGQYGQVFAGTIEEYHEIWWFYVSDSNVTKVAPDKYVVYNYVEDIWYIGTMDRSAWLDSPVNDFPLAATNTNNLVEHENGNDDGQAASVVAIDSFITSGQFGIESGNSFTFVDKLIPDMQFLGSNSASPSVDITLLASSEPGAADNSPLSQGGNSSLEVLSSNAVDQYTDQLNIRVRGRQMAIKISSDSLGTRWQLGTPTINMRPDGRRGS